MQLARRGFLDEFDVDLFVVRSSVCRGTRSTSTTRPALLQGELHWFGEDKSGRLNMVSALFRVRVQGRQMRTSSFSFIFDIPIDEGNDVNADDPALISKRAREESNALLPPASGEDGHWTSTVNVSGSIESFSAIAIDLLAGTRDIHRSLGS
jgi:hypothetical protein